MTSTFLATGVRILWRVIEAHGLDAAAVFREVGLDPALLDEPRGRYPLRIATRDEESSVKITMGIT